MLHASEPEITFGSKLVKIKQLYIIFIKPPPICKVTCKFTTNFDKT